MQPIEAWSVRVATLSPEQAAAVAAAGLVRVELADPPDRWRLTADSRVGIVGGEGWELRVVPRLSIPRLMFLLGYALDPRGWRDLVAPMVVENDLFGAVAAGFAAHAHRALELGPLRGYVALEETSQVLRGRLRVREQIGARGGLPLPLEIERDDYTMDIQENQLLAAAASLLLRLPRIPRSARSRLHRIRALLADVSPPASLVVPAPTRLNRRYAPALTLAALILRRLSVGTERGSVASTAFVFDMNMVFEDFLTTAITDALGRFGGYVRSQFSGRFLDA